VVPKVLLDAASVAADRTAWLADRLLQLGNDYAKRFKKLNATQQRMVEDYIIRANAKGLKFNSVSLKSLGMTNDAVEAVRAWKTTQDTLWHFENGVFSTGNYYTVPVGQAVHFIALSFAGMVPHFAIVGNTVENNHLEVMPSLQASTSQDFQNAISNLP
jgi:hypothetical protein